MLREKQNSIRESLRGKFKEYQMLAVSEACDAMTDNERRSLKRRMRRIEWGIWYLHDDYRTAGTKRAIAYDGTRQTPSL